MDYKNRWKSDYLKRYRIAVEKERLLADQIEEVMARAYKITASFSQSPVSRSGTISGNRTIEAAVEKADELRSILSESISDSLKLRGEIENAIKSVEDERLRLILTAHYINGKTLHDIADEMYLDERWLRRLHQRALDAIIIEDHSNPAA